MDRFILTVDRTAGLFVGSVALLTFLEAFLRYVFSTQIPDWFNLTSMLQAMAICWGIASATYEGRHVTIDIVWEVMPRTAKRWIDIMALLVTIACMAVFAWMLMIKVGSVFTSHQVSIDLHVPLWPAYFIAAVGIFGAVFLGIVRLWRLIHNRL